MLLNSMDMMNNKNLTWKDNSRRKGYLNYVFDDFDVLGGREVTNGVYVTARSRRKRDQATTRIQVYQGN